MDIVQFCGIMLMICAAVCAIGWIGWGLTEDKLKKERRVNEAKAKLVQSLLDENLELKRQVAFMKFERETDLSKFEDKGE